MQMIEKQKPIVLSCKSNQLLDHPYHLYRHSSTRKSKYLTAVADDQKIKIQASSFFSKKSENFALAVIHENNGEQLIRFVECEYLEGEIFIRNLLNNYTHTDATPVENEHERDYRKNKASLNTHFGTNKVRNLQKSAVLNAVNTESINASSLSLIDSAISAKEMDQVSLPITPDVSRPESPLEEYSELLPPHDHLSLDSSKIYTCENFIPSNIAEILPASQVNENHLEEFSPFISQMLQKAFGDEKRVRLVLLLHYMCAFQKLTETAVNNQTILNSILNGCGDKKQMIEFLIKHFTEKVTDNKGKIRHKLPVTHKDRICVWIAIGLIILGDGRANATQLAVGLSISVQKSIGYFRAAGCIPEGKSKDGSASVVIDSAGKSLESKWMLLKAPLEIPKTEFGRKKGARK